VAQSSEQIVSPEQIVDTAVLIERKRRAVKRGVAGADFLMQRAAEDLADRLATVGRRFSSAAALFCVTSTARDAVQASGKADEVLRVEADPAFLGGEPGLVVQPGRVAVDPASLDLAVSLLSLQDENDIPGMLVQIRRALKPDGLFLGALAGAGTLAELRDSLLAAEVELAGGASPRVLPFADVRDAGGLLQRAGFALPVTDVETVTVRYADMFALMADLRAMGATNVLSARSRKPATREFFAKAAAHYAECYSDPDGRIRATFSFIWLSGWAPDASQQKPLRPGSAEVSLTRVLEEKPGPA
jgi:SAM-dependent methyltransferase